MPLSVAYFSISAGRSRVSQVNSETAIWPPGFRKRLHSRMPRSKPIWEMAPSDQIRSKVPRVKGSDSIEASMAVRRLSSRSCRARRFSLSTNSGRMSIAVIRASVFRARVNVWQLVPQPMSAICALSGSGPICSMASCVTVPLPGPGRSRRPKWWQGNWPACGVLCSVLNVYENWFRKMLRNETKGGPA